MQTNENKIWAHLCRSCPQDLITTSLELQTFREDPSRPRCRLDAHDAEKRRHLKANAVQTLHENRWVHFAAGRSLLGHFRNHEKLLDTNRFVNILDDTSSL